MKKSVLLGTGILAAALLTGCGGSSSGGSSLQEYGMSAYDDRTVSVDTLAGTWVAAGTGSISGSQASGRTAFKEYFIIRETQSGYEKARCEHGFEAMTLTGDQFAVEYDGNYTDKLSGTITDNSQITGVGKISHDGGDTDSSFLAVKISDAVTPLGTIDFNISKGGQVVQSSVDLFCAQQANSSGTVTGVGAVTAITYEFGDESQRALIADKSSGAVSNTWFDGYFNLDTDNGDSVNFEVTSETALTLTMSLSGSSSVLSGTGTVQIQLPVQ